MTSPAKRDLIYALTAGMCHYCGAVATTLDHIVPRALGGRSWQANLVGACGRCNQAKADSWPTCACIRCAAARTEHHLPRPETGIPVAPPCPGGEHAAIVAVGDRYLRCVRCSARLGLAHI